MTHRMQHILELVSGLLCHAISWLCSKYRLRAVTVIYKTPSPLV